MTFTEQMHEKYGNLLEKDLYFAIPYYWEGVIIDLFNYFEYRRKKCSPALKDLIVYEIKEKYDHLRVCISNGDEECNGAIELADQIAFRILCEKNNSK